MPWSEQNPITGIRCWKPSEKELLEEAIAAYSWLIIYDYEYPRQRYYAFAELAEAIRRTYDAESQSIYANRHRIFA